MYGICNLSLVPLRADASDKSEMINQLLFGDHFEVLEENEKWAYIRLAYDFYEGWIDKKQFTNVSLEEYKSRDGVNHVLPLKIALTVKNIKTNEIHHLLPGSSIRSIQNNKFDLAGEFFELSDNASKPDLSSFLERVEEAAKYYLNAPYLWGGRSLFGIDCSGFTQIVFKQFGIRLKRDAWQQAEQGELVAFLPQARLGDLAFFQNNEGRIVHVGIMLDNSKIIHASGKVRIDLIDSEGIFNEELNKHTHRLRVIKRFV
jgi:cell wall-associated NlpC family hydrolase